MRVMRGHRGYIQYIAGQIRWFNVYTPNQQDRDDGVRLWEQYWRAPFPHLKGVTWPDHVPYFGLSSGTTS